MPEKARVKQLITGVLLTLLATGASAVEVVLESVTAGGVNLRVDGRAKFDFDPDTSTLSAAGTWTAEYVVGRGISRLTHRVEDMRASMDGQLSMRSYECVEGTFGATLAANSCGNYRFGPNGIDDGGTFDDVVVGPPKSLASFAVTALTWDGESLLLALSAGTDIAEAVFPESVLELRFSAVDSKPTSNQSSPR